MPSIQVVGVLEDPITGIEPNAEIKIISKINYGQTTKNAESLVITDVNGGYDFPLVYGKHLIAVKYEDSRVFTNIGTVSVGDGLAPSVDLITLILLSSTEDEPDLVNQLQVIASEAAESAIEAEQSAQAAATSESNAATSAASANQSATSAANSESAAATSASNAATSENNAASSATSASNSATAASQSESNAATSASNAAQSAADAQAAFDNFDDKYLGSFATEPTTDNDGDPLQVGMSYWNSTTNDLYFYNGAAWESPELTASQAAQSAAQSAQDAQDTADSISASLTEISQNTTDNTLWKAQNYPGWVNTVDYPVGMRVFHSGVAYEKATNNDGIGSEPGLSADWIVADAKSAEERLLGPGSTLYRGRNGSYVQNGDAVEPGTTHLSVPINGKPEDVAISPLASGVVSGLTETGATIGGTDISFIFNPKSILSKLNSNLNVRVRKRPVISFMFDDGYPSAAGSVRTLFSSRNVTCSLALNGGLLSRDNRSSITSLLDMQRNEGYEIVNHGLGSVLINSASDNVNLVESEINGGLFKLNEIGFDVQGFNAVSSSFASEHLPKLKEQHAYGITQSAVNTATLSALQNENLDSYLLHRTSLYSIGLAGAKSLIDLAVANNGWACFYDHDPDQIDFVNSMSLAELTELLDYAISSGAEVLNYRDAIDYLSSRTIKGRGVELISEKLSRGESANIICDSDFRLINLDLSYDGDYAWNVDSTLDTTYSLTRSIGSQNSFKTITVDAGATPSVGRLLVDNQLTRVSTGGDRLNNITFQVKLKGKNSATSDNLSVTIGIIARKIVGGSVVATNESSELYLDGVTREYKISIDPNDYDDDMYVQSFIRVIPKTSLPDDFSFSKAMIYSGDGYKAFTSGAVKSSTSDFTFSETTLTNGAFTVLEFDNQQGVCTSALSSNRITVKEDGTYKFRARLKVSDVSISAADRFILEARKNGSSSKIEATESYSPGGVFYVVHDFTMELISGDYIEYYAFQQTGGDITHTVDVNYSGVGVSRL